MYIKRSKKNIIVFSFINRNNTLVFIFHRQHRKRPFEILITSYFGTCQFLLISFLEPLLKIFSYKRPIRMLRRSSLLVLLIVSLLVCGSLGDVNCTTTDNDNSFDTGKFTNELFVKRSSDNSFLYKFWWLFSLRRY